MLITHRLIFKLKTAPRALTSSKSPIFFNIGLIRQLHKDILVSGFQVHGLVHLIFPICYMVMFHKCLSCITPKSHLYTFIIIIIIIIPFRFEQ